MQSKRHSLKQHSFNRLDQTRLHHNRRLAIALLLLPGLTGLVGCTTPVTSSAPNPTATVATTVDHSKMDHGQMHHGSMSAMEHSAAMDLGPADANYDLRFIDAMIPHHQGAIAMANAALKHSKRPEIQTLAKAIIAAQNREINEIMQPWRKDWYPDAPATPMAYNAATKTMQPMTAEQKAGMMMAMDLGTADDQFDLRFLNAMIPHHEGALVMAQDALAKTTRPELKQLANDIITAQKAEIAQMKAWRKAWYP